VLGLHQDADVAIERLRRLAVERSGELDSTTVFAMGEIAERYRQSMAGLRSRFPRAYRRLSGRRWRELRRVLEERRPAPPAPPPAPAPDPEAAEPGAELPPGADAAA
jgi:hypothetical protein